MYEVYWLKRFKGKWEKLGVYYSFQEAYKIVNAIMKELPTKTSQSFRITPAINYNYNDQGELL